MIAIIDYNAGNISSVQNALNRLGYESIVTRNKDEILKADKVILFQRSTEREDVIALRTCLIA